MAKKAAAESGGVASATSAPAKPAAKPVTKEAGTALGADAAAKAPAPKSKAGSKSDGAGKVPVEITQAMIAEAAYFLHVNGVPGTPEEHWATAEAQLRSNSAAPL